MTTPPLDIALTVFFAIFVVIDIAFNVILLLAIYRKRSLHTPMNLLILHLSVTDILTGVFIIPRHIVSYAITYPNTSGSDYICKLITGGNFIWTSATCASGILTIIALERFFAVVHPHKASLRVTKRRLKWLVWACWISSFAFNLPSLLVLEYNHEVHFCLENWPSWADPKAYVAIAFFAGNFSVFTMFVLYSIILYSLWKKDKNVSEVSRLARINARKRVTRMLILMTIVHMICRTPNYTFYTLSYFDPDAQYGSTVYSFTVFLILLNSASHPFFFCWYMKNLRREVAKVSRSIRCPRKIRGVFKLPSEGSSTITRNGTKRHHQHSQSEGASGLYSDTDDIYSTKTPTTPPTPTAPPTVEYNKNEKTVKVEFAPIPAFDQQEEPQEFERSSSSRKSATKTKAKYEEFSPRENVDEETKKEIQEFERSSSTRKSATKTTPKHEKFSPIENLDEENKERMICRTDGIKNGTSSSILEVPEISEQKNEELNKEELSADALFSEEERYADKITDMIKEAVENKTLELEEDAIEV